jgi:hypothetical protein
MLYDHGIFKEKNVWKECIKFVVQFKIDEL